MTDEKAAPHVWAGIGGRQSIELGIGIACGFALVYAIAELVLWMLRQFN